MAAGKRVQGGPAFAALKEAVFRGEVDTAIVWQLDRRSRKQAGDIGVLADCCERGVRVVSVTQRIDL
ncbi:MAG: recombinase family protein [Myxococcales bacterium]|nr:recombinase family protein [Myxococcales bacterium]